MSSKLAVPILAALAGLLFGYDFFFSPAHAGDQCLVAPNAPPPSGSHWYYRLEHSTERKCWYLGPEGQEVRSAPSKTKAAVKRPAPPPTSVAEEQQTSPVFSAQVDEPPMPALPAVALSAPATVDAPAPSSDLQTSAIAVAHDKFATAVPDVETPSTTKAAELIKKAEPQPQRYTAATKDTAKSSTIRPALLFVFVPAGFALACVLVAIFPAAFRRQGSQVDRHEARWDTPIETEPAPTITKSAALPLDQAPAPAELRDELKRNFTAASGWHGGKVDRREARWDTPVENEPTPTIAKSSVSAPDQSAACAESPDELKSNFPTASGLQRGQVDRREARCDTPVANVRALTIAKSATSPPDHSAERAELPDELKRNVPAVVGRQLVQVDRRGAHRDNLVENEPAPTFAKKTASAPDQPAARAELPGYLKRNFPAAVGRQGVQIDRGGAHRDSPIANEPVQTIAKGTASAPDQQAAPAELPDDLKRKLHEILHSLKAKAA